MYPNSTVEKKIVKLKLTHDCLSDAKEANEKFINIGNKKQQNLHICSYVPCKIRQEVKNYLIWTLHSNSRQNVKLETL